MLRRYSFIFVFFVSVTLLGWWAKKVESSPTKPEEAAANRLAELPADHRVGAIELVEVLDRIVAYEHYYRSVYGHFTKFLNRVGVSIPGSISNIYEIRVIEAAGERLLVTAIAEASGKTVDQISIDQDYQVRSTFPLPPPRSDYLKVVALKQLRVLRDAPEGRFPAETGVFRDYFRYDVRSDSASQRVAFAVGIRPPVVGVQLELGPGVAVPSRLSGAGSEEEAWALEETRTGQQSRGNVMHTLEQAYLAQQIFRGEVGRYARSWSELSGIADFRFEGRERIAGTEVPFGDGEPSIQEIDISRWDRDPAGAGISTNPSKDLIVEPIEDRSVRPYQSN